MVVFRHRLQDLQVVVVLDCMKLICHILGQRKVEAIPQEKRCNGLHPMRTVPKTRENTEPSSCNLSHTFRRNTSSVVSVVRLRLCRSERAARLYSSTMKLSGLGRCPEPPFGFPRGVLFGVNDSGGPSCSTVSKQFLSECVYQFRCQPLAYLIRIWHSLQPSWFGRTLCRPLACPH